MSRLFKEYKEYLKAPPSDENHQIIEIAPVNADESIFEWHATIAKQTKNDSTYYYGGQWKLEISCPSTYPMKPPVIKFATETPINHPNINISTGEICLDILKSDHWSPAWNLKYLVVAILMLLDDPEPDSPLNIDSANLFRHDKVAFESVVQYTIWKYATFAQSMERQSSGERIIHSQPNYKVIHDVGEEVTKQFIAKVDEISNNERDLPTSPIDYGFDPAREQVTKAVTKQVENLYSKSKTPKQAKEVEILDESVERIRRKFIQSVEDKVSEHLEHNRPYHTTHA